MFNFNEKLTDVTFGKIFAYVLAYTILGIGIGLSAVYDIGFHVEKYANLVFYLAFAAVLLMLVFYPIKNRK